MNTYINTQIKLLIPISFMTTTCNAQELRTVANVDLKNIQAYGKK